ncbi:MAG: hypothetical protein NVSMB52_11780 [Chloroflexota bacterium]
MLVKSGIHRSQTVDFALAHLSISQGIGNDQATYRKVNSVIE